MSGTVKNLAILGSTGSIGQQTLDIVRGFPDNFKIIGLAGGENVSLLAEQVSEFQPKLAYSPLKTNLIEKGKFSSIEKIASHPEVDLVVIATSGKVGLAPALAAIRAGKRVALANKEILAMAGEIVTSEAKRYKAQLLPVDSEHSAVWQCLRGESTKPSQVFLTASGGPFRNYSSSQMATVTVEEALEHPTWRMGKKVTIDSATLMNKGLEVIEAHWFFSIPLERIKIIVHPQSIIHALVEFADGSLKAQLSFPDMHLPIQYALFFPEHVDNPELVHLDLSRLTSLDFEPVDYSKFPCLRLALSASKKGGTYPAVLCAADEVAVELFLAKHINFQGIARVVEETLNLHQGITAPAIEEILAADAWARETATRICHARSLC